MREEARKIEQQLTRQIGDMEERLKYLEEVELERDEAMRRMSIMEAETKRMI